MKTDTNQPVLGKFLNGHYKIIQILSTGAFGYTYLAEDTWLPGNPQCVVKHFQAKGNHPKRWEICKRLFMSEAQTLNNLGYHDQIPQLLDCIEDKQGFYLVEELIVGKPLSAELPIREHCGKPWSEVQCVELLDDVLGILEFIHSQGVIHCDLHPKNLIRRTSDGRLVLIDFGAARPMGHSQVKPKVIPIQRFMASVAIPPLGYVPAEQLIGQPRPNSDLYALGMIAIETLTGLNPMQLQADPNTGELNWQQHVSVSESMVSVLNPMVRYDFKDRYQSVTDARRAIKGLAIRSEEQGMRKEELSDPFVYESPSGLQPLIAPTDAEELALCFHTVSPLAQSRSSQPALERGATEELQSSSTINNKYDVREVAHSSLPKIPPLLVGVGAGLATSNAVAISLGLYTLLHYAPSNPGLERLLRAIEEYRAGNFDEAIALAQSIPLDSDVYQDSVDAIGEWRKEWNTAAAQFKAVEEAFNEGRWRDVLEEARKTPNVPVWQHKIQPFVLAAKPALETEAQQLLQQAYQRAAKKDFTGALTLLKQIPQETTTGAKIQPKITEYRQNQQIKAETLLQQAYQRAANNDFNGALKYLSQIPEETPAYEQAQIKIAEYSKKQDFLEEVQRQAKLSANLPQQQSDRNQLPQGPNVWKGLGDLNPGSQLKEVTPKVVRSTPVNSKQGKKVNPKAVVSTTAKG